MISNDHLAYNVHNFSTFGGHEDQITILDQKPADASVERSHMVIKEPSSPQDSLKKKSLGQLIQYSMQIMDSQQ